MADSADRHERKYPSGCPLSYAAADFLVHFVQLCLMTVVNLLRPMWTRCNELALNVQTTTSRGSIPTRPRGEVSEKAKHGDHHPYASLDYWYVYKIARILNPVPEDVIYDLGSGMGRFICVMARRHVRKCVGVELFEWLCQIAVQNARQLRGRKAPIEIVHADCATVDLSDGSIYFMFNPFGPDTLRDTLGNIRSSLSSKPRYITIVYYNSLYEPILEACDWLEEFHHFHTFSGLPVTFWRNRLRGGLCGFGRLPLEPKPGAPSLGSFGCPKTVR